MSDALISPATGAVMFLCSAAALAYSLRKSSRSAPDAGTDNASARQNTETGSAAHLAIMGAFVFAAQMVNFAIPLTGSSGHLIGAVLLCFLTGPYHACVLMGVILSIQCLFFADGGLLALGANIFNMGVIPCLVVYPLISRLLPICSETAAQDSTAAQTTKGLTLRCLLCCLLSLEAGALMVSLQTLASGMVAMSMRSFTLLMAGIHLPIALVEGIITALIVRYAARYRPALLNHSQTQLPLKAVLSFALLSVLTAGGLSLLASSAPDGLEWSLEHARASAAAPTSIHTFMGQIQDTLAVLPDYAADGLSGTAGTALSGIIGVTLVFVIAWCIRRAVRKA